MNRILISFIWCTIIFSSCKEKLPENKTKGLNYTQTTKIKTAIANKQVDVEPINVLAIVMSEAETRPSFKIGGIIQSTNFKEGDQTRKGQLLATLYLDEINAQLKQAEEGLAKSERDLQRATNLHRDSVATLEQVQNATTAVEVMKKNVEVIKFNKLYSEVRSPISGRIIKKMMNEGEIVGPGMPVCIILGNNSKDWKVKAGLIDSDWALIQKGDKARLSLDAYPGKFFDLVVKDKSAIGGNASSTMDVDFKFLNPPQGLAAGLIGKVQISKNNSSKHSVLVIPLDALTETNGDRAFVFVIDQKTARKTNIQIGKIFGNSIEVLSGIQEGQKIATTGVAFLEDGESIIED